MLAKDAADMDFEVFPYRKGEPSVTINSQGKISLNKGARHALEGPEYLLLKFNAERRVMALEPCEAEDTRAHPIRNHKMNNAYTYARSFLEHYGLSVSKTMRYEADLVGGALIVDLNQGDAVKSKSAS